MKKALTPAAPPKKPFMLPFNRDTQDMMISAIRYAMGRRTYIVKVTVDWAIPLLPHCEDRVLRVLMSDFHFYEAQIAASDDCDIDDWKRLRAAIVEERVRRIEHGT